MERWKFRDKDCIPATHPLSVGVVGSYSRESANRVVAAADLVCFIGTSAGGMTTHVWAVPKIGTPALQIDIEPETIGRNYPLKAGVLADAKTALSQMLALCDRKSAARRSGWLQEVKKIGADLNGQGLLLRVNPDIARALKEEESAVLRDLRQSLGKDVTIKPDEHLHHEQFDVMAV